VAAGPAVEKIEKEFDGKVRLVIKFYPYKYRDFARISAEAALCAGDQGKFSEMHHLLLKKSPRLNGASLIEYAKALGLNVEQFTKAFDAKKHDKLIERDLKLAFDLDLYNTPTFFINGRKVVGNVPYEYLKKIVIEELKVRSKK
jgi:protein-disulfide isomerase